MGEEVTNENDDLEDSEGGNGVELVIESMRQKLSNLFHRVSEVCTAVEQLIANVLIPLGKGGATTAVVSFGIPFQVVRTLLQCSVVLGMACRHGSTTCSTAWIRRNPPFPLSKTSIIPCTLPMCTTAPSPNHGPVSFGSGFRQR